MKATPAPIVSVSERSMGSGSGGGASCAKAGVAADSIRAAANSVRNIDFPLQTTQFDNACATIRELAGLPGEQSLAARRRLGEKYLPYCPHVGAAGAASDRPLGRSSVTLSRFRREIFVE